MGKKQIVLITGGSRSGKSRMALTLAAPFSKKIFLATAIATDDEMEARIERHRKERSKDWNTIEEPTEIAELFRSITGTALVLDCLTVWLSNLLLKGMTDSEIDDRIRELGDALEFRNELTVLVTNEVGMGIVPENDLARRFRDLAGMMNQTFATHAGTVIFMVSGLPMYLKKEG